jgi:hypothetical protein
MLIGGGQIVEYEQPMTTNPEDIDVSVVLAAYKEKNHLRQEIERIRRALETSP